MHAIISDGGVSRFDDLHIDVIDESWKDRKLWIPGAIEAYKLARTIAANNGFDFSIAVGFSLESSEAPRGINFKTRQDLEGEFDWTPPSLYLFHPGTEPWAKPGSKSATGTGYTTNAEIDTAIFQIPGEVEHCTYLEFRQGDASEYCRSIFVWG